MKELDTSLMYYLVQIRRAGKRADTRGKFFPVKTDEQFKHLPLRSAKTEILH